MKLNFFCLLVIMFVFGTVVSCRIDRYDQQELPNILWITSEDNSPFMGCYGDSFATTPNLDKLASEGFLYTHAYANAPVCAPARNTIITGVYSCSGGNQHMRSSYKKNDEVKFFPQFLRELGYYCINNDKKDYNIEGSENADIWDDSSKTAHYMNRKPGQPFFAVFNTFITHESCLHQSIPTEELKHDPKKVPLPPYHPETPEMKHDWAQYYDKMEDMDVWGGEKLKELDENGLADNTIVIYYGDHGGVLARSKRYVYESGTRVPLIIRIPEKYKYLFPNAEAGTEVNRLVSFVDLAPTLLSVAGISVPDYMQGSAFLGEQKTGKPEYAYMFRGRMDERYDMSRAVRNTKYRYIKNYMPHRIYGQHLDYLWKAPSISSWEKAYSDGQCNATQSAFWERKPAEELYDTENDPWEVNNLAGDPNYNDVLKRMRQANRDWVLKINDTGFIPEADWANRFGTVAPYDFMRTNSINLEEIVDAADLASLGKKENLQVLVEYLENSEPAIRYWGATGLLILGEAALPAKELLEKVVDDSSPSVAIVAAEALFNLGERGLSEKVLLDKMKEGDFICTFALNSVDALNLDSKAVKETVHEILNNSQNDYSKWFAAYLVKKWERIETN